MDQIPSYKYGARLLSPDIPPDIFKEAYRCRDLWNRMVAAFEENKSAYDALFAKDEQYRAIQAECQAVRDGIKALRSQRKHLRSDRGHKTRVVQASPDVVSRIEAQLSAVEQDIAWQQTVLRARESARTALRASIKASTPGERKALTAALTQRLQELYRDDRDTLAYSLRLDTLKHFEDTLTRYFTRVGRAPQKKEGPLHVIRLVWIDTGTGVPVDTILRPEGWRRGGIRVGPYAPGQRHVQVWYGTPAGTQIAFRVTVHRPPHGDVRSVALIGRQVLGRTYQYRARDGTVINRQRLPRWEWSMVLGMRTKGLEERPRWAGEAIGIDLGWRLESDTALRIMGTATSDGLTDRCYLPPDILESWRYVRELQARMDTALDQVKAGLTIPDDVPTAVSQWWQGRARMRISGLRRAIGPLDERLLARDSDTYALRGWVDAQPSLRDAIRRGVEAYDRLYREYRGVQGRWLRRRRDYYRNLARDIAQTYATVVLEQLPLNVMARRTEGAIAAEAAKHRQLAGLSEFRGELLWQCRKAGSHVLEVQPRGTSSTCAICGRTRVSDPLALTFVCEQGHTADREENAAGNILARGMTKILSVGAEDGTGVEAPPVVV
jgi:hypothetical protein